mmetsp:Transcript_62186/g.131375  ORF Transcript_62186/g.131375 Transcript_62186/m.131375 type:complete len:226 (-) Transcript_62186:55-732(-)
MCGLGDQDSPLPGSQASEVDPLLPTSALAGRNELSPLLALEAVAADALILLEVLLGFGGGGQERCGSSCQSTIRTSSGIDGDVLRFRDNLSPAQWAAQWDVGKSCRDSLRQRGEASSLSDAHDGFDFKQLASDSDLEFGLPFVTLIARLELLLMARLDTHAFARLSTKTGSAMMRMMMTLGSWVWLSLSPCLAALVVALAVALAVAVAVADAVVVGVRLPLPLLL